MLFSKFFIFIYVYIFLLRNIYKAHDTFPISVAASIPYAPHLNPAINITFNITITTPEIKLPTAYLKLSPSPLDICNNIVENIPAIRFVAKKYLYSLLIKLLAIKNITRYSTDCIVINSIDVVIIFLFPSISSLQSIKYLKIPCSICNVTIGKNRATNVFIKSTTPYCSVVSNAVYNGNKKNVINCVHIFPIDTIAVFFINCFSLFILYLIPFYFKSLSNALNCSCAFSISFVTSFLYFKSSNVKLNLQSPFISITFPSNCISFKNSVVLLL